MLDNEGCVVSSNLLSFWCFFEICNVEAEINCINSGNFFVVHKFVIFDFLLRAVHKNKE